MKDFGHIIQYYNHQGSVAVLTDNCGHVNQQLQYLPYGGIFVDHRPNSYASTYTFSAKEKDSESGYTYFGARYYSDNMMQWLSVDPMSDERPWISPYNYCQWNPIGRVDTWGMLDEIVIRGMDGSKTTYVPGMSSEGYDDFTAKVINNYNDAYNGSATAREDIDNLVNAKGTYQVVKSKDSGFRNGLINGEKAGLIYYNPEGGEVPVQKSNAIESIIERNPIASLIHETIHASRYQQGIYIEDGIKTRGTLNEEIATMDRENMFRENMGYNLRTHHMLIKSPGQQIGSGFPMLNIDRESRSIFSNYTGYQFYK